MSIEIVSAVLLPCPFCGGEPRFERIGTPRLSCIVACLDCGASLESPDQGEQSGSSWNTRASPALTASAVGKWQPIESAPKNRKLIVGYFNGCGNWRSVMGKYYVEGELEQEDVDGDDEVAPEGWYECSDTHETILLCYETPTHWQPLPEPPSAATSATSATSERGGG
jgi:Lar family restriction alleviation protein